MEERVKSNKVQRQGLISYNDSKRNTIRKNCGKSEKGEYAGYQHFLLYTMFSPIKTYFANLAAPKLPSVDAFNYDQF